MSKACISDLADDHMMGNMTVSCCCHMNRVDLFCVCTARDPCHGIVHEDHYCKVSGIEVLKVTCCHLPLGYNGLAGSRLCDSNEDSCPCSNSAFETLLVEIVIFLHDIRTDISVFWVVQIVSAAPVVVSWDLGGDALALGVVLVALVAGCL